MKIYQMLVYLRGEPSSKKCLKFIKENPECHEVLKYLCNPYIKTGLSHIKNFDILHAPDGIKKDPDEIISVLVKYFSNCGPNGSRDEKETFAKRKGALGPRNKDWEWTVELIATHGNSSKFGVGGNTVLKAGIEIPTFGCQLGTKISDVGYDYLEGKRWRMSEKVDGTRRLFIKRNGTIECYSRSGRSDNKLRHINECFAGDNFPDNYLYDCEIVDKIYFDDTENSLQSFEVRAKSIGKAARKTGDKTSLVAICFDFYDFGKPDKNTLIRTRELKEIFKDISDESPVRQVKIFGRMDGIEEEKLSTTLGTVLESGGEGLMLQELSSKYVFKRTPDLLKVKRLEEFEGQIVDILPGRKGTRLEHLMSALRCKVKGVDNYVNVGSGLSDYDRELFTKHKDKLIGSKVEIEAFSKTINKHGLSSLCFPVFKRCYHKLGGVE